MDELFVTLCEGLYSGVEANVLVDGQQSGVEEGFRQGCPLSLLLYSMYVMGRVEELEKENIGVELSGVW